MKDGQLKIIGDPDDVVDYFKKIEEEELAKQRATWFFYFTVYFYFTLSLINK